MASYKETDERVVPALLRERAALIVREDTEGVKAIDEQLKARGYVKKEPEKTPPIGRSATPLNKAV
jgi:hypothetical protein